MKIKPNWNFPNVLSASASKIGTKKVSQDDKEDGVLFIYYIWCCLLRGLRRFLWEFESQYYYKNRDFQFNPFVTHHFLAGKNWSTEQFQWLEEGYWFKWIPLFSTMVEDRWRVFGVFLGHLSSAQLYQSCFHFICPSYSGVCGQLAIANVVAPRLEIRRYIKVSLTSHWSKKLGNHMTQSLRILQGFWKIFVWWKSQTTFVVYCWLN